MPKETATKTTRIYCNYCKQDTNHDLKGEHEFTWYDDDAEFGESNLYRLWICMGCEHGVLQHEHSNSEMSPTKKNPSIFPRVPEMNCPPSLTQN